MQNYNDNLKIDIKERSYRFSLQLIEFLDSLREDRTISIITKQVLRSGTSVGANLAEGRASSSRLEYKKYCEIALKSANETRYWLELL